MGGGGGYSQDPSTLMFTGDVLRCGVKYRRYYVTEAASHDGLVRGRYIKTLIMGGAIFSANVKPSAVHTEDLSRALFLIFSSVGPSLVV